MTLEELNCKIASLLQHYEQERDGRYLEKIEVLFDQYIAKNPYATEVLLRYSIFLYEDLHDDVKALNILKSILAYDAENIYAVLLMADISFSMTQIYADYIFEKLLCIKPEDSELASIVEYAKYIYCDLYKDPRARSFLEKSLELCGTHVWNNQSLGELYAREGRIEEGRALVKKALSNVRVIYGDEIMQEPYRITSVDEYLNQFFKGTHITKSCFEFIEEDLEALEAA